MNEESLNRKLRTGLGALLVLAILTAVEFVVALEMDTGRFGVLSVIAIAKTWIIVDYFMHITQLWHPED